jgi:hypothetical protein
MSDSNIYYKYLKYKMKYLIKGGDNNNYCLNDFENVKMFKKLGGGLEANIFKRLNTTIAYKVYILTKEIEKGAWGKPLQLKGGGITLKKFEEVCVKYKNASDKKFGPIYFGSYTTKCNNTNIAVIIMQAIDGDTVLKLKKTHRWTDTLETGFKNFKQELYANSIIDKSDLTNDEHDDNFMVDINGKFYAIDF